jgi:hypothetical protein
MTMLEVRGIVKEMGERVSKLYFGIFVQIYLVPGVL